MKDERKTAGSRIKGLELSVFILACLVFGYAFTVFPGYTMAVENAPVDAEAAVAEAAQDFSKFKHGNPMHTRLPCLLCHVRTEGATKPKFPGHMPCAGCHVQQFSDNTNPICILCHTSTGVKPFPALRSFNAQFDHGRHVRQTGCATCHKPSRRGVALSIPSGANAHSSCFQCHGPRTEIAGRNIGSCGTCHLPGRFIPSSDWSKAYTLNFSHQEHARQGKMNCAACHTVRAGEPRGRQVSGPAAVMHFAPARGQSCGGCHNNKTAFGAGDFTNCKRCHEGKTFKF